MYKQMFQFRHLPISSEQSIEKIQQYLSEISKFCDGISASSILSEENKYSVSKFNGSEVDLLKSCLRKMGADFKANREGVVWYPSYAAALCGNYCDSRPGYTSLKVVGLDGWKIKPQLKKSDVEYTAETMETLNFEIGLIPTNRLSEYLDLVTSALNTASKRLGEQRSASGGRQGHQYTPAFLNCAALQAIKQLSKEDAIALPYGGTTDVGIHCGGKERSTSWPLVCAVLKSSLSITNLYEKMMVHFELKLLEGISNNVSGPYEIDECLTILDSISQKLVAFLDQEFDVSQIADRLSNVFTKLKTDAYGKNASFARKFNLPVNELPKFTSIDCSSLTKSSIDDTFAKTCSISTADALKELSRHVRTPPSNDPQMRALLDWLIDMKSASASSSTLLFLLHEIEQFMYAASTSLINKSHSALRSETDMESLVDIIEFYKKTMSEWLLANESTVMYGKMWKSKELIVRWVGACLVHQRVCNTHTLAKPYAIPLDCAYLSSISADDKSGCDAILNVIRYIRTFNESSSGKHLFSISDPSASFEFAREFSRSDVEIQNRLNIERQEVSKREKSYWEQVSSQKRQVSNLRGKIPGLQEALSERKAELNEIVCEDDLNYYRYSIREAKRQVKKAQQNLDDVYHQINRLLTPPNSMINPLPKLDGSNEALKVLFFLLMPRELVLLCSRMIDCQRALIPPGEELRSKTDGTDWVSHYNSYSDLKITINDDRLILVAKGLKIPRINDIGPSSIETITSGAQGMWFPSGYSNGLRTKVNDNPFEISFEKVENHFTDIAMDEKKLSWTTSFPHSPTKYSSSENGNFPYARLNIKPNSLDKDEYLALAAIRSYPNQQIRKIISALNEPSLSTNDNLVRSVIRIATYQLGPMSKLDGLDWKVDLEKFDALESLYVALKNWADNIRHTPRNHRKFPLLCELCGFVSQYYPPARMVSRSFKDIAIDWSKEIEKQMSLPSIGPEEMLNLRARECLVVGYAILGISAFGPLSSENAEALVGLLIRFRKNLVLANDAKLAVEVKDVMYQVNYIMSHRIKLLLEIIKLNARFLTSAFQQVYGLFPSETETTWVNVKNTTVFECKTDNNYWIDVYSGEILINGSPPHRLPQRVRSHPAFKRCFGDRDFEVSLTNRGYTTNLPIQGCFFYNFEEAQNENLRIREIKSERKDPAENNPKEVEWELIDFATVNGKSRWQNLPVILKENFSVWGCREQGIFVFRPHFFRNRTIFYICDGVKCYEVPVSLRSTELPVLLTKLKNLAYFVVDDNSKTLSVLEKFELCQFIHTLLSPSEGVNETSQGEIGTLFYDLPRFRLSFDVKGGKYICREVAGYALAPQQQLSDTFPYFKRYLVLERLDSRSISLPRRKILIPDGEVNLYSLESKLVTISTSDEPRARLKYFMYDEHEHLSSFIANSILSRLHLATTLSASGSMLVDERLRMTGSEAALIELRKCWVNRPLTEEEAEKLKNLAKVSFREPSVEVVVNLLFAESQNLHFLFLRNENIEAPIYSNERVNISVNELRSRMESRIPHNLIRQCLSKEEQLMEMSEEISNRQLLNFFNSLRNKVKLYGDIPAIDINYVASIETKLQEIVKIADSEPTSQADTKKFPLEANDSSELAKEVMEDLRESWQCHQIEKSYSIGFVDWGKIENLYLDVEMKLANLDEFLAGSISLKREDRKLSAIAKLFECTNRIPLMTFFDRIKIACEKNVVLFFNMFLSESAVDKYHELVLVYLELIVLSDKLKRIRRYQDMPANDNALLVRELQCRRMWSSKKFPQWLVFEAEGCLQIRPEQFTIAQHLLKNPGTISQLNMGLGKTRVILPMLIIQYSRTSEENGIPRVTMLSSLIREGSEYLHQHLTASALSLRVFELPFHRDVALTPLRIRIMEQYAKRKSSCLVVAPEHRCSLDLKKMELKEVNQETYSALCKFFKRTNFANILDESDAVLSYKYQLVYAVGNRYALKNCEERSLVAQALLRTINNPNEELKRELRELTIHSDTPGPHFKDYRVIRKLTETESIRLRTKITINLLQNLPYELNGLKAWCKDNGQHLQKLILFLTDSKIDIDDLKSLIKNERLFAQILAIRGFLAFGLLEHALQQRNKIEYGVDPNRKPKQMSIPYRAADVPSERSEFSHPDVGILLTILGYYYEGLTMVQLTEAFKILLSLGLPAQKRYYKEWLASISCDSRELGMIGKVENIDLTNQLQFNLLFSKYQKSMEVINFWLNSTVFRTDTAQYEKRILATSWNLTDGNLVVGFSGTNDNRRLLPLHVVQREPNVSSLLGTNGRMLENIVKSTSKCQMMDPSKEQKPMWKVLLERAVSEKVHALIDTGGQLASVSNKKAAEYLLSQSHLDPSFRGVCYFDPTSANHVGGCWMILDRVNRVHQHKADSSIHERECFVFFDDARSRGADMKLLPNAIAGITLGQRMNKDKLMQGAGRLRQLGDGQKLVILIPKELETAIQVGDMMDTASQTIRILRWVMANTISSTTAGLGQWSSQGLFHSLTNRYQDICDLEEDWTLETLYERKVTQKSLKDTVLARISKQSYQRIEFVNEIKSRCSKYGADLDVVQSDHLQECEKELQIEQEEEEENEAEIKEQKPTLEKCWDYLSALRSTTPMDLQSEVEVLHLSDAVATKVSPENLQHVAWDKSNVYVTMNFLQTVVGSNVEQDYLRIANAALIYCEKGEYKATLLLSDMEADGVLGAIWNSPDVSIPVFAYMKFIRNVKDEGLLASKAKLNIGKFGGDWDIPEIDMAAIQLWNGETMFPTQRRKDAVSELISRPECEIALREFVYARGLRRNWASSDLERMVQKV